MALTLLIQPMFAPDEARHQRNLASVRSLVARRDGDSDAFACLFGGWGRPDLIADLAAFISDNVPNLLAPPQLFSANVGKAALTNALYAEHVASRADVQYLWLIDSDMVVTEPADAQAERLIALSKAFAILQGRAPGLIAHTQDEHNCHIPIISENTTTVPLADGSTEVVLHPNEPSGIAGGSLLVSRAAWDAAGGYRQMGVYAGEDGWLVYKVGAAGFSYGVAAGISVLHPYDGDPRYIQWKRDSSTAFQDESTYAESRAHADAFWLSEP